MKVNIIALFLAASVQSKKHHRSQQLLSIGEMVERHHPRLLQVSSEIEKWDQDVLGLVDVNSYVGEQKASIEDQNVDIEF